MGKHGKLELKADLFLQQASSLSGPLSHHGELEDHLRCTQRCFRARPKVHPVNLTRHRPECTNSPHRQEFILVTGNRSIAQLKLCRRAYGCQQNILSTEFRLVDPKSNEQHDEP